MLLQAAVTARVSDGQPTAARGLALYPATGTAAAGAHATAQALGERERLRRPFRAAVLAVGVRTRQLAVEQPAAAVVVATPRQRDVTAIADADPFGAGRAALFDRGG